MHKKCSKCGEEKDESAFGKDRTKKDIDLLILSKINNQLEGLKEKLNDFDVNIEHAIYYPQKINYLLQFVTNIYVNPKNQPFLQFDSIYQPISWESLEPWKVILENKTTFTVRNPLADYYAYQFRTPSGAKSKDLEKLKLLKKLCSDLSKMAKRQKLNYFSNKYFTLWEKYIEQLNSTNNIQIKFKKMVTKIYWNTIGEYLAHGRGVGKYLIKLQNKFTGSF